MQKSKQTKYFIIVGGLFLLLIWIRIGWWEKLSQVNNQISTSWVSFSPTVKNTELIIPRTLTTPNATNTIPPISTVTPTSLPTKPANGVKIIIGYSVQGRELEVFQFGNGDRELMIVAGIHGGYEWNTVSLADELIIRMMSHEVIVPQDVTLYILRNMNPDGYEKDKGPDGRANTNNIDLNRNWDANWKKTWWGTQCWSLRDITAGVEPESEPETRALKRFLLDHEIEQIISYHSAGLGIFSGGWPDDVKSAVLAQRLSQVSPYPYPPIPRDCEYTGQLANWASSQGIAAVDIELTNHTSIDLEYNLNILEEFLD